MLRLREAYEGKATKKPELPKEIQSMLQAYEGIVINGKPSTLSIERAICHRIDLISRDTLHNKAT